MQSPKYLKQTHFKIGCRSCPKTSFDIFFNSFIQTVITNNQTSICKIYTEKTNNNKLKYKH